MREFFAKAAKTVSSAVGSPYAFVIAAGAVAALSEAHGYGKGAV